MEYGDSSSSSSSSRMPSAIDDHQDIPFHSPVLAYFPRKSAHDAIPIPPTPTSPSIISSLLTSAGVDATLYPPRTYPELGELILAVQDSLFDTLRRNALLYYLLLDYHLLPANQPGSASAVTSLSSLAPRSPIIAQFAINHLLPAFWTDSVERGFWRFDKGLHNEAVPWLNTANSSAYANHILRTLSPLRSNEQPFNKAECLIKYVRIAKPILPETQADLDVVEAVVVGKAIVEGLQGALELIRERPISEHNSLFATLWQWLFQLQQSSKTTHIRSSLLQSVVALPLSDSEVQTLVAFSLGRNASSSTQTPSSALLRARQLALDTLLVRLLNAGRVLDALKVNSLAEESQGNAAVEEEGGEAGAQRRKKRREMLRLAREMLPEVVRSQLEEMRVAEEEKSAELSSRNDQMDEDVVAPETIAEFAQSPAPTASFNAGTPGSNLPIRGYMHNRLAESTSSSRLSMAATPPPPQQRSTPVHQRVHVPLISQSPLAFAASRGEASFSRASPSGTRFTPTPGRAQGPAQARSGDAAAGDSDEGPYARLAAQLASQANGEGEAGAAPGDESVLLASLLPQKRSLATRRLDAEASASASASGGEGARAVEDGGDASFEQQHSRGGFEVPKRRYTKKDQVSSKKSETPAGARNARNASASPAPAPAREGQSSRTRGASGLRKSTTMSSLVSAAPQREDEEAPPLPASRKTPRSTGGKKQSTAAPTTPATGTRRSTRAQSESVPGSFPGAAPSDEEGEEDAQEEESAQRQQQQERNADAPPEMLELPSASRPTSRSSSSSKKGASTSTPRRTTRAKTPSASATKGGAGAAVGPTESTPVRRSARRTNTNNNTNTNATTKSRNTRGSSRASSVLSSRFGDGDGDGDEDEDRDGDGYGYGDEDGEEGDALGHQLDFGSASASKSRSRGRNLRTRTRSMSVLSTSTAADEDQDEDGNEERGQGSAGEEEVEVEDGVHKEDGDGDGDGDETATRRGAGGGASMVGKPVRRSGRRR